MQIVLFFPLGTVTVLQSVHGCHCLLVYDDVQASPRPQSAATRNRPASADVKRKDDDEVCSLFCFFAHFLAE